MVHTHLLSWAGTVVPVVAGVPSRLTLTLAYELTETSLETLFLLLVKSMQNRKMDRLPYTGQTQTCSHFIAICWTMVLVTHWEYVIVHFVQTI
jgi:hypothetical protein